MDYSILQLKELNTSYKKPTLQEFKKNKIIILIYYYWEKNPINWKEKYQLLEIYYIANYHPLENIARLSKA